MNYFFQSGREGRSVAFIQEAANIEDRLTYLHFHPQHRDVLHMLEERWATTTLGRALSGPVSRGVQPSFTEDGDVPALKSVDVRGGLARVDGALRVSADFAEANKRALVKQGEIIVTSTGFGSMGRVAVYQGPNPALISGELLAFEPPPGYDGRFLALLLDSAVGKAQFNTWFSGSSGQIHLYESDLEAFIIPSVGEGGVSLERQREIVEEVAVIEAQATECQRQASGVRAELAGGFLRQLGIEPPPERSYFYRDGAEGQTLAFAASADELADRLSYLHYHPTHGALLGAMTDAVATVPLAEVVREPIRRGAQPSYDDDADHLVLKTVDIRDGWIDYDGARRVTNEFFDANEAAQAQRGDVLVTATGFGSMGKAAVYDRDEPAVVDGHISIVRTNNRYDPYFLASLLRSGVGAVQFDRWFSGSSGQIEMPPSDLGRFLVPSPEVDGVPLAEQQRIAGEIREQEREARRLEAAARERREAARQRFEDLVLGDG